MTGIDWMSIILGGLGVIMIALAPFAKPTGEYRELLDPFGPAPWAEREFSKHESEYNLNPRVRVIRGGVAFIVAGILLQLFRLF